VLTQLQKSKREGRAQSVDLSRKSRIKIHPSPTDSLLPQMGSHTHLGKQKEKAFISGGNELTG